MPAAVVNGQLDALDRIVQNRIVQICEESVRVARIDIASSHTANPHRNARSRPRAPRSAAIRLAPVPAGEKPRVRAYLPALGRGAPPVRAGARWWWRAVLTPRPDPPGWASRWGRGWPGSGPASGISRSATAAGITTTASRADSPGTSARRDRYGFTSRTASSCWTCPRPPRPPYPSVPSPGRAYFSPKQVRDWIRSVITRHECPVDPADTALAVSELYANAVMHGPVGGRVLAGYRLWSSGARIVVCDGGGPATPHLRQGIGLAEGGRGLQVIDSLAARWGSFRLSGSQVVWCDFGQPLRALTGDAWAWLHRVLSACPLSPPARPGQPPEGGSPGPLTVPGLGRRALVPAPVEATRRPRGSAPSGPARLAAAPGGRARAGRS